jgi:hypothetical protein
LLAQVDDLSGEQVDSLLTALLHGKSQDNGH